MKICQILNAYPPYSCGGADIYGAKISKELAKMKNPVTVITISSGKGQAIECDANIKIYRFYPFNISTFHNIGKKSFIKQGIWTFLDMYNYYSYQKIRQILKREKPDVVHLHTPIDVTLSAIDAVKSLKLPLVYTLHDYFLLCRRIVLLHGFERMCSNKNINPLCRIYREFTKRITDNKIDIVTAPSRFVLDMHAKYGFFKNTKTVILPHGIEPADFNNSKYIKISDAKQRTFNILYAGGLTKHKGVHILISAFKQIKNQDIKLHILGGGAYENELKSLAKGNDRIIFYGKLTNQDVQKYYRMADVSVVPSIWHDVYPTVILESFRAGTPVIGSFIGGIPELIKNNHNGFLFEPGNIKQLKFFLEDITNNPIILKELGNNAKESSKQYEMSKYIQKLCEVYNEAMRINRTK